MPSQTEQWEALCEEHAQAMSAWRDLFARNSAGMAAVFRGNNVAQPSMAALAAQEAAWDRVGEIDARMKRFILDNG